MVNELFKKCAMMGFKMIIYQFCWKFEFIVKLLISLKLYKSPRMQSHQIVCTVKTTLVETGSGAMLPTSSSSSLMKPTKRARAREGRFPRDCLNYRCRDNSVELPTREGVKGPLRSWPPGRHQWQSSITPGPSRPVRSTLSRVPLPIQHTQPHIALRPRAAGRRLEVGWNQLPN